MNPSDSLSFEIWSENVLRNAAQRSSSASSDRFGQPHVFFKCRNFPFVAESFDTILRQHVQSLVRSSQDAIDDGLRLECEKHERYNESASDVFKCSVLDDDFSHKSSSSSSATTTTSETEELPFLNLDATSLLLKDHINEKKKLFEKQLQDSEPKTPYERVQFIRTSEHHDGILPPVKQEDIPSCSNCDDVNDGAAESPSSESSSEDDEDEISQLLKSKTGLFGS